MVALQESVAEQADDTLNSVAEGAGDAADGAVEATTDLAGEAADTAGEAAQAGKDALSGTTDAAADAANEAKDDAFDVVDDLKDGLSSVVETTMDWLPKLAVFVAVLILGYFVAKLIARAVKKVFEKINFDHYVDKSGLGAPLERAGFSDSGVFASKVIYYLMLLFVLKIAFDALGIQALNATLDDLITWIPKFLVALILIVVGGIVANAVRDVVIALTSGQPYSNVVTKVAFGAVWLLFGLAALNQAEIAGEVVNTLTQTVIGGLGAIMVIKFGIGGIWAAKERFWPYIYDTITQQPGPKS